MLLEWNIYRSLGVSRSPRRVEKVIKDQPAVIVQSFHPATAVCYNICNANYRVLLIYHFASAFTELHKPIPMPSWMKTIRKSSFEDINKKPLDKEGCC